MADTATTVELRKGIVPGENYQTENDQGGIAGQNFVHYGHVERLHGAKLRNVYARVSRVR